MDLEKYKQKTFWERPEGTTGMVVGALSILTGVIFASSFGALIVAALSNVVTAGVLLIVLAVLFYIISEKKFRTVLGYFYKMAMRRLTQLAIETDPVAIVLNYVEKMKNNRRLMEEQIGNLNGQINNLQKAIDSNKSQINTNLSIAKKAKAEGRQELAAYKALSLGRLSKSNDKLGDLLEKMKGTYQILLKMHEVSGIVIENTEEEVKIQIQERKALTAGYSAWSAAKKIIDGEPDLLEDFNAAMDFMAEDCSKKVGEMETWINTSKNFVDGIEMQKSAFVDKGLEMLEQWESSGSTLLLTDNTASAVRIPTKKSKSKWE